MTTLGRIERAIAAVVPCIGLVLVALSGAAPVQAQDKAGRETQGEIVFREQGCYGCHTVGKVGTPIAPDLSGVGKKRDLAYLTKWLRDPLSQRPTAHMPKLELSEAEVRALAAYLASLR